MTIRDEEGDILAGRHLNVGEDIAVGKSFIIDFFHIKVLECVQAPGECDEQIEFVDLTRDAEEPKPAQRVGGRFWILADDEEDDDEDLPDAPVRSPSTFVVATSTSGSKPKGHGVHPYVVATHSDGGHGAFDYCIYPMGDGSVGYFQPVWMAVM